MRLSPETLSLTREKIISAFYIFMPFSLFLPVRAYNVMIVTCFVLILCFFRKKPLYNTNKVSLFILVIPFLVLAYALLLDFSNGNLNVGLHIFETFLPLIFFPVFIIFFGVTSKTINQAKISFFISAILAALTCLGIAVYKNIKDPSRIVSNWSYIETQRFYEANPIDPINWGYFLYLEFSETIGFHPIYLGIYYILAIVFALSFIAQPAARWLKAVLISGVLFLIIQLLLLGGKMPIVIFTLLLITFVIQIYKSSASRIRRAVLTVVVILVVAISVIFPMTVYRLKSSFQTVFNQVNSEKQIEDGSNRIYLWKTNINLATEKLWSGYGLYGAREAQEKSNNRIEYFNSHNQYLMFLLVAGLCGLLFFLIAYSFQFYTALKTGNHDYIIFLIIIGLILLTENLLSRQKGIVFYSFFNSVFFFYSALLSKQRNNS